MSEEILKALMELFALIVKQDGGMLANERSYVLGFLTKQLTHEAVDQYMELFDSHAGQVAAAKNPEAAPAPSVKDSVKILNICKKINRTLNQAQKVVVLMRLYELVNSDRQFTPQRMNIINTVAEVFRISFDEFSSIELFIRENDPSLLGSNPNVIVLCEEDAECGTCGKVTAGFRDTTVVILRVASADIYFLKYSSENQLYLNGLPVSPGYFHSFPSGSSLRSDQGVLLYYTDMVSKYQEETSVHRLSLEVRNVSYRFPDGNTAVNDVSFSVAEAKLVGILGASGSGKTTLLNILSGISMPTSGEVLLNGQKVHSASSGLEGVIGYVPQDDMLHENLTVYGNLYYAAALSFSNKPEEEIRSLVEKTLASLGLLDKKDLRVGSPLNKVISGGQRKRLNIALELIREPSVLFLDEPTSGLSSRDSENVMDLLRELTLKGKLVATVLHQPSSDIFKMFDKVAILDQGGYLAYFGNPVESVIYFKTLDSQINSRVGECPSCGNVNPESIFRIIETQVVDEFGRYTSKRKVTPPEWNRLFIEKGGNETIAVIDTKPHSSLVRPGFLRQLLLFLRRDIEGKVSNRQYMLLTLLEAPILGFILSFIIRYIADPSSNVYIFKENENIPIYIFMSIIVALFLGLVVSAEEIFRDRIILRRERFLNLNRHSYLLAKVAVLVLISALQTGLFLAVANPILGIKGLYPNYFITLFATAFCANMLGLNISSSLNSAITIYIVIPLLMIPMMVLSGAMFPFDKLNRIIGSVDKVPVIAELMPTRWTYEALMVSQFKDNEYGKIFYEKDKERSIAIFNLDYRIKEMDDALALSYHLHKAGSLTPDNPGRLGFLRNELEKISTLSETGRYGNMADLFPEKFSEDTYYDLSSYLSRTRTAFDIIANRNAKWQDDVINLNRDRAQRLENNYHNIKLKEIITKMYEPNKSFIYRDRLIQNYDPVYQDPEPEGFPMFRTHFFAPAKYIFGKRIDTLVFNAGIVLLSTVVLYLLLYLNAGARIISRIERLRFKKTGNVSL